MYSQVVLIGRFTAQPELKVTPSGVSISSFDLAVDRRPNGKGEKQTDFISCVAFGKSAENLCKYMDKGRLITVIGRLQTRTWEANDGGKRKSTDVVVNEFVFMPSNKPANKPDGYYDAPEPSEQ